MDTQRPPLAQAETIRKTTKDMDKIIENLEKSKQTSYEEQLKELQLQAVSIQREIWRLLKKIWRRDTDEMPAIQQNEIVTPAQFRVKSEELQQLQATLEKPSQVENDWQPTTQFESIDIADKIAAIAAAPTHILRSPRIEKSHRCDDLTTFERIKNHIEWSTRDHIAEHHLPVTSIEMCELIFHSCAIKEWDAYITEKETIPFVLNKKLRSDEIKTVTLLL